jgi:hypothetical protein
VVDSARVGRRGGGRLAVAGAAVVAAVALSACTPSQAGAAATIDGRRISASDVTDATTGIKVGNPQLASGPGLDRTVLFYLLLRPYVLDAAQANGVAVSEQEAAGQLSQTTSPDPHAVQVLQTFLALQKLQQLNKPQLLTRLQDELKAAKPSVNPRYGRFDATSMTIVDAGSNWLVPTPTATAQGTP